MKINKLDAMIATIRRCAQCRLAKTRRQIVYGRGQIPADILFLGEGPGRSEDLLGEAFIGSGGKLLDKMIIKAAGELGVKIPRCYFTNTVLCHPTDIFAGDNRPPNRDEVLACTQNIISIYKHIKPKLVVFVGKVSGTYYRREFPLTADILHPAYLLRSGGVASPYYRTNIVYLITILERVHAEDS